MTFDLFMKSLLLLLRLNEFYRSRHVCFLVDEEDQSLQLQWNLLENLFESKFVVAATCQRFQSLNWINDSTTFVAMAPCNELMLKNWIFWKKHSLVLTPSTKRLASELDVNYNSRIYHIDSDQSVFETFKYQNQDTTYIVQRVGEVTSHKKLAQTSFIWDRRSNLSSIHLNIIYVLFPPLIMKQNNSHKITGVFVDLFYALQQILQFNYSLFLQEDNKWGSMDDSGSFDGLFGEIQRGKANWSIAHTSINAERSQFFDFSIPVLKKQRKIVTRRRTEGFDAFAYLIVFSIEFWMTLLFSTLVLIFLLYCILRLDSNNDQFWSYHIAVAFNFTIVSLFCRENFPLDLNLSGKIICLVILFWGFLISASYNAILTSALASYKADSPIDSLDDMLNSPDYTLVFSTSGSTRDHFKKASNGTTEKEIYQKFLQEKPGSEWNVPIIPLHQFTEDVALLITDIEIYSIVKDYGLQCEIVIHTGKFMSASTLSFAFQKDFPLSEVINYHILKFEQSGLLDQLLSNYFSKPNNDCLSPVRELGFQATYLCFAILALGIIAALIFSVVEKYRFRRSTRVYMD